MTRSLISAAAIAMMNMAYGIGCEVRFTHKTIGGYDKVDVVEPKKEKLPAP